MKKYFTGNDFKNFNTKRSGASIAKLSKSKERKRQKAEEQHRLNDKYGAPSIGLSTSGSSKKKKKFKDLVSPNLLSCIDSPDDALSYINQIKYHRRNNLPMHINMYNIEDVTVDALLAIISVIKNYSQNINKRLPIKGRLPENKTAQKAITDSGFFEILKAKSSFDLTPSDPEIFTIHSGDKCDTECGDQINKFVESCYKEISPDALMATTKLVYSALLEFMGNAYDHAYSKINQDQIQNWYLSAQKKGDKISFTLLDNGHGLASTIRRRKGEIANLLYEFALSRIGRKDIVDCRLIEAAFLAEPGERSQTGLRNRGKGLPHIYSKCIAQSILKNFTVISNKAYVKFGEKGVLYTKDLKESFMGTLYYWEIAPGGEAHE